MFKPLLTILPLLPVSILAACQTTTGVMPMGPDTYVISVGDELGGTVGAQKSAITEANAFCAANGAQVMPVQTTKGTQRDWAGDSIGHYEFVFRCLKSGDPDLGRPMLDRPDIVIRNE